MGCIHISEYNPNIHSIISVHHTENDCNESCGVCCINGLCVDNTQTECANNNGIWYSGVTCDDVICPSPSPLPSPLPSPSPSPSPLMSPSPSPYDLSGDSLDIYYDWSDTGQNDLDTSTVFLGANVGWSCPDSGFGAGGTDYLWWDGDNTGTNAVEVVHVYHGLAFVDGLWSGSTTVELYAGWYAGNTGSGPCTVRVLISGRPETEQSKTINPGSQDDCASTFVGSITINQNGTFTLN